MLHFPRYCYWPNICSQVSCYLLCLFCPSAVPVIHVLFFICLFFYFFNILLFNIAPKPTSPDVLTLSIKDAPTTPQSALETGAVQTPGPLRPLASQGPSLSSSAGMISGAEPEGSSSDVFGELRVTNVTSTSMRLAWSAPDEAFDSFLVELNAVSGKTQAHVTTVPGSVRKAEIEGLSPSTRYHITLHGLVEGERSLPLKVFATTGTWSRNFFSYPFITTHSHISMLCLSCLR